MNGTVNKHIPQVCVGSVLSGQQPSCAPPYSTETKENFIGLTSDRSEDLVCSMYPVNEHTSLKNTEQVKMSLERKITFDALTNCG